MFSVVSPKEQNWSTLGVLACPQAKADTTSAKESKVIRFLAQPQKSSGHCHGKSATPCLPIRSWSWISDPSHPSYTLPCIVEYPLSLHGGRGGFFTNFSNSSSIPVNLLCAHNEESSQRDTKMCDPFPERIYSPPGEVRLTNM